MDRDVPGYGGYGCADQNQALRWRVELWGGLLLGANLQRRLSCERYSSRCPCLRSTPGST